MKWKNINLAKKFAIAFGILIGVLVVFAIVITLNINSMMKNSSLVVEGNELQDKMCKRYNDHLKWTNNLGEYVIHPYEHELKVETDPHKCKFGEWYYSDDRKKAEEMIPELKSLFEKLEKPHELLHHSAIKIKDTMSLSTSQNKDISIQDIYEEESLERLHDVALIFDEISKISSEHIAENDVKLIEEGNTTILRLILSSIGISIFAILFAIIIARGVIIPLRRSIAFAEKISDGDLTARIDIEQTDEAGKLVKSLRKMRDNLKEIVYTVKAGAESVDAAAVEFTASSQNLSEGANEQAAAAEEISSSVEEMSSNIQQNTDNAQQTEKIALQAANEIQEGSKAVTQTVEAMKKIANKISIITDIAFQTNILALNAAVEAARAGEHGKGFAVVAAEVRKLAERSQIAANEINEITGSSVEIAEKSGKLLVNIIPNIQNTSRLVQEITAASIEMNSGANQVNNAIQQLSQSTQENATSAEQMASASQELATQAQRLNDAVSFFKVEDVKKSKTVFQTKKSNNQAQQVVRKTNSPLTNKKGGISLQLSDSKDNDFETF